MGKRFLALFPLLLLIFSMPMAQDDPVLFSVEDKPVHVSEFNYIYSKTNGEKADFSRKSLEEYLDLYVKFKLKVQKAREMQLDTIPALKEELAGYRRQLANSYLIDKEVTDRLIQEAYDRSSKDVDISHIMVLVREEAAPKDSLAAYNKILEIKSRLEKGEDFGKLALEMSDDKSAKDNKGRIGYVTALFPKGFYNFETAAYNAPKNKLMGPIRTFSGYHIFKVHGQRQARGEMEASHILIRKPKEGDSSLAKTRIDSVYQAIQDGANFEELAKMISEDKLSAKKGGNIGNFGINRFEKSFEDVAFSLAKDGDISKPVESSVGWHVIKRINKTERAPFAKAKRALQTKVQKDPRFENSKTAMVERIKKESNYKLAGNTLSSFKKTLNEDFFTHKWKASAAKTPITLFFLGGKEYSLEDFEKYCQKNSRVRMRIQDKKDPGKAVDKLFDTYLVETCMQYEETQLDTKYPEFKALMREYEEGILLFEATKMLVWDKASQDTVGLNTYHEQYSNKYKWRDRAEVSIYTVKEEAKSEIKKIKKLAQKSDADAVLKKFNKGEAPLISVQKKVYEKGKNDVLDVMNWKKGSVSAAKDDKRSKTTKFMKIENILPSSPKSLSEARGYVVADYQDHLERKWIKELKQLYKVEINQEVYDALIK